MGESIMNLQIFMVTMCILVSILFLIILIITRNSTLNGLPVTKKAMTKLKNDKTKPQSSNIKKLIRYKNLFLFIGVIAYLIMAYLYLNYYSDYFTYILILMAIIAMVFEQIYKKQNFQ